MTTSGSNTIDKPARTGHKSQQESAKSNNPSCTTLSDHDLKNVTGGSQSSSGTPRGIIIC